MQGSPTIPTRRSTRPSWWRNFLNAPADRCTRRGSSLPQEQPSAHQRQDGPLRPESLVLAGACLRKRRSSRCFIQAWDHHPDFLTEVARLSPSEDGPLRAELPGRPRNCPTGGASPSPNASGWRSLLAARQTTCHWSHPSLRPHRQLLVQSPARTGTPGLPDGSSEAFVDDLELPSDDAREAKADAWAQEALIPSVDWDRSTLWEEPTPLKVIYFANSLGIHPAIVAGRIRCKTGNYRLLSQLVGTGMVRQQFQAV